MFSFSKYGRFGLSLPQWVHWRPSDCVLQEKWLFSKSPKDKTFGVLGIEICKNLLIPGTGFGNFWQTGHGEPLMLIKNRLSTEVSKKNKSFAKTLSSHLHRTQDFRLKASYCLLDLDFCFSIKMLSEAATGKNRIWVSIKVISARAGQRDGKIIYLAGAEITEECIQ